MHTDVVFAARLCCRLRMALVPALGALAVACSSSPDSSSSNPPPPGSPSTSSLAPSLQAPAPIELDCADAGSAGVPPPSHDASAYGLTFTGVSASGQSPLADYELPVADELWHFRKVFLYVSPAGPPVVQIHLEAPGEGRIYWTGESGWTGSNLEVDSRIVTGATDTVVVPNCDRDSAGFFGGVLAPSTTCIRLTVTPVGTPSGEPVTIAVPIATARC